MNDNLRLSAKGIEFLKDMEGVRYTAYLDTGGVWTIGVGHTGPEVIRGLRINEEQVNKYLQKDVIEAEDSVKELVKVPLSQSQFDALVSFTFNLGENALSKSTLLRLLNAGDYNGAMQQMNRWVYDNGKLIAGLVKRRKAEQSLWSDQWTT